MAVADDDLRRLDGPHPDRVIGRRLFVSESTASTNDDARRLAEALGPDGSHGYVVATLRQLEGRGTRGRVWWSPPGASLALSVILAPAPPIEQPAILTVVAALALVRAGADQGARLQVKWPNDVVDHMGRKVAGILAETLTLTRPTHVVGIGVNVRPALDPPPASLAGAVGTVADAGSSAATPEDLLEALLSAFEAELDILAEEGAGAVVATFNRLSWLTGRLVTLRRGRETRRARFLGMTPDLEVEFDDDGGERRRWLAAQVELVQVEPRTGAP